MDWSPPGSSVHGILQARVLEWVAIPFSRGSFLPRDQTQVSCIAGRLFTNWATKESQLSWLYQLSPQCYLINSVVRLHEPWNQSLQAQADRPQLSMLAFFTSYTACSSGQHISIPICSIQMRGESHHPLSPKCALFKWRTKNNQLSEG